MEILSLVPCLVKAGTSAVFCWVPDHEATSVATVAVIYMGPYHEVELLAVIFASSYLLLFYLHGKASGLTLRPTSCLW